MGAEWVCWFSHAPSNSKTGTSCTRDEIARFGIDRREVMETPWIFESAGRNMVCKTVLQIELTSDGSFRSSQWRLFCNNADQFELDTSVRPWPLGFSYLAVSISVSAERNFISCPKARWGSRLMGCV